MTATVKSSKAVVKGHSHINILVCIKVHGKCNKIFLIQTLKNQMWGSHWQRRGMYSQRFYYKSIQCWHLPHSSHSRSIYERRQHTFPFFFFVYARILWELSKYERDKNQHFWIPRLISRKWYLHLVRIMRHLYLNHASTLRTILCTARSG